MYRDLETLVRQHSIRPGFELVSYRPVALPIFRVKLEVLVLERNPIPPIAEFIMRSVESGITTPTDLAGFLGLDEPIITDNLHSLIISDDLAIAAEPSTLRNRLALTDKGRTSLTEAKLTQPEKIEMFVDIDGLTRSGIIPALGPRAIRPSLAAKEGLAEVPAHPRRKPGFDEVSREAKRQFDELVRSGLETKRDLLQVLKVSRTDRFYRDDAVMLFFRAVETGDLQIGFLVDERRSEAHEIAFGSGERASQVHLIPEALRYPVAQSTETVMAPLEDAEAESVAQQHALAAEEEAERLSEQLKEAEEPTERAVLRDKLREAEENARRSREQIENLPLRHLATYEHPAHLEKALLGAQLRLMINSPWITAKVVDDRFLRRLKEALDRRVDVYIGYGLSGEPKRESYRDQIALDKLKALASQYPNFVLHCFGDTHAKVLICDTWAITTSFNWLSFRGDPKMPERDERGFFDGLPEHADQLFETYLERYRAAGAFTA